MNDWVDCRRLSMASFGEVLRVDESGEVIREVVDLVIVLAVVEGKSGEQAAHAQSML